jgi:hypothetical protein
MPYFKIVYIYFLFLYIGFSSDFFHLIFQFNGFKSYFFVQWVVIHDGFSEVFCVDMSIYFGGDDRLMA